MIPTSVDPVVGVSGRGFGSLRIGWALVLVLELGTGARHHRDRRPRTLSEATINLCTIDSSSHTLTLPNCLPLPIYTLIRHPAAPKL